MVLGLGKLRNAAYASPNLLKKTGGYVASLVMRSKGNVPDTYVDKALHLVVEFIEKETPALSRRSDKQVEQALKKWTVKGKRDFGKVVGASTGALLASMLVTAYLLSRYRQMPKRSTTGSNSHNRSVTNLPEAIGHPERFTPSAKHAPQQNSYWKKYPNAAVGS
jgi:hypothetical protein